jgi:hypothetical protein
VTGEGDEAGAAAETETETATARREAIAADGNGSERVGGAEEGGDETRGIGVEGKVVGRELEWRSEMGGQISTDRPGAPRRGTCGAAACCRCGRGTA